MFVLHIGLKKSGSASIQTFLAANRDALAEMSVDYTTIGRGKRKAHHNLVHHAKAAKKFNPRLGTLEILGEAAAESAMDRVLVSSEMFEGCEEDDVSAVKAWLGGAGREIRIVLIIRDLLDLIPSSYAQKIRFGLDTFDFDTFFDERIRTDRINYFETARRWGDVFGWDALSVRLLDSQHLKNGDLIDDFLDAAGVDLSDPRVAALQRPGLVNSAAGWKVLEALRGLHSGRHGLPEIHPLVRSPGSEKNRGRGKDLEHAAREVGESMGWNEDRGNYYTRDQAKWLLRTYSSAIKTLNSRLPTPLPRPPDLHQRRFVAREFLPDVSQIRASSLRVFYDAVGDRMRQKAILDARLF